MHPTEAKKLLRQSIAERLARLSPKDRAAESRSVCRRVMENLPTPPLCVCAYIPLKDEVDIHPLLEELLATNYELYLPRFEGKLVFRRATDLKTLTKGKFDIPEPPADAAMLDPQAETVVLVPGRAFTRDGQRMGRGNGGYDIWIRGQRKANPATQFWGVCFEHQVVNEVPMEGHDERVDATVTARMIIRP